MIKLRTFLILTFTSFVILLTAVLGILLSNRSAENLQNEIGQSLSSIAYQMSDKLDNFMWSRTGEVEILAAMAALEQNVGISETQKLLTQLKASFPSFSWVGFMNNQGDVLAATDGILVGTNISERPVFKEGIKGKFIGDVHEGVLLSKLLPNPSGEPLQFVDISLPVTGKDGKTIGVLAAHLSWEWSKEVQRTILEPQKDHIQDLELFIISKKDSTVLLGPQNMVGEKLDIDSVKRGQSGENDWKIEKWPDGKSYLTGYAYGDGYLNYEGLGWTVLVRQPEEIAFSSMEDMIQNFFLTGFIASIIFAIIGSILAETISRPIRGITSAADRLRSGGNVTLPEYKGFKEIHSLSTSLRSLVESLSRSESALGDMKLLAEQDQLTGLPNRIALERYLENTIEQLDPHSETLAFMYIDLDGFKKVNDTLGHQVGDLLLQKVAQRLLEVTKAGNITVRLGGDEFLLILRSSKTDSYQLARETAEEIIDLINKPYIVDLNHVSIGCSIGAAFYPMHDQNVGNIIRIADECLYRSKQSGKNRVTFYEETNQ
ncbi:sensor domain-containing diguanylate cyclase [Paenibacillus sp. Marseille-Q4541]|uniref:sensor domain-containing diguanylate cyclase n=1 Tax=Paenibacillus sp. Marseille-Q4541 TaxID=2831522 RepID=UPI001BA799DA|nr:sensor domain-containing diguanylate cyclase [Paenibacillus sp. Marseille-Q4541]